MSRKKKQIEIQPGEKIDIDSSVKIEAVAIEEPKPREFEARPCSSCQALRPHGTSYSRVYCTRGRIRYCKCDYCGHTWSQEGK